MKIQLEIFVTIKIIIIIISWALVMQPLIPALGRQRQVDFCEFEASLVYKS